MKTPWTIGVLSALMLAAADPAEARPSSPFTITASLMATNGDPFVRVSIFVPPDHVVYADHLRFETPAGSAVEPARLTPTILATDKATGEVRKMFDHSLCADLGLDGLAGSNFLVRLQGCSNSACYFPEKHCFQIGSDGHCQEVSAPAVSSASDSDAAGAPEGWQQLAGKFRVVSQKTGFVPADEFVSYLRDAKSGEADVNADPVGGFTNLGVLATLALVVLGGLGLNLTPCVLPLIPINLAIIGAGRAAQTRRGGFALGAAYGAGMTAAYGVLGVAVVMTGAKFGTLNSSVGFNLAIALIFGALSLAMFDVFQIDFTRFSLRLGPSRAPSTGHSLGAWFVAFALGGVSALMAGACVAPVVISVLLLAANLFARGIVAGLLLPFLLGAGMALPWPFMGASLSFLPKPGKWMVWVKRGFGAAIMAFAGYYASLAYGLARPPGTATSLASAPVAGAPMAESNPSLVAAFQDALSQDKPVFVDFKASWCKNCEAMDRLVFNQEAVRRQLDDFVVVKYEAERPNEPPAKDVLDHFGVLGLPTYLVLVPVK